MRTRRPSVALIPLLFAADALARDIEPVAGAFLDIDVNPRGVAMGGTGWTDADGLFSAYSNPAGLSYLRHQRAGLMHAQWFEGLTLEWIGYGVAVAEGSGAAIAATFLRSGAVDRYDGFGNPQGTFHVYDAALGASFGQRVLSGLRAGVTAKAILQSVDDLTATGVAGDLGVRLDRWGGTLGFMASNFGPEMTIEGERFPLPTTLALGATFPFFEERVRLNVGATYPVHYYEDVRAGVELRPVRSLALRAGYRHVLSSGEADQLTSLTWGVGIWASGVRFDYAYQPFDALGETHRLALSTVFGRGSASPVSPVKRPADAAPPLAEPASGTSKPAPPAGPERKPSVAPKPEVASTPEVASAPEPASIAPAAAPSAPERPAAASRFAVVAGTHRTRLSALQELRSLRINGLDGGTLQKLRDGRYRVVVYVFANRRSAEDWIDGPGVRHGKLSFSIVPVE